MYFQELRPCNGFLVVYLILICVHVENFNFKGYLTRKVGDKIKVGFETCGLHDSVIASDV